VHEIDFGQTEEEERLVMRKMLTEIYLDAYGNGKKGYFRRLDDQEAVEAYRHKANTFRLNIIIALSGFAVAILTAIGIIVTVQMARHASLDPQHFFQRDGTGQVYTALERIPQDAKGW
jgi:hypothetical protein